MKIDVKISTLRISKFVTLLFFLFLTLKLTHVINWGWLWIFAPIWGAFLFLILFLVIVIAVLLVIMPDHF
ncbi:MAG: hypothetical protein PVJ67_03860 [Candidatus Pacearchaeota archaeon]|jgi:hypothetical protein